MDDDLILLTGGTGHLGRDIVRELLGRQARVRVLARMPGTDPRVEWARGDLSTGDGLREALTGVTTVISAATFSPIAQRGSVRLADFVRTPRSVDVEGTRRLLEESRRAEVSHFVHVSIVGLDPDNPLPYNRVKLAGENLVRQSDVPWSVVHATPFFYLMARIFLSMRWMPLWPLPDATVQPVDTRDVAQYLVECVRDGKRGVRADIGGPETRRLAKFAQEYLDARELHRPIVRLNVSGTTARRMGIGVASGRRGSVTWRDWLASHEDEPRGRVRSRPSPPPQFSA